MARTRASRIAGETTITGRNQVSLPSKSMRELGWQRGDRIIVETLGEDILLLVRRPLRWADAFAARLTDVFGTHEETLRWIDEEREKWQSGTESDN